MVLTIDGALVPTRPDEAKEKGRGRRKVRAKRAKWEGEWREEKGFRFYLVDGARIEHVLCWHQVQSSEELKECLKKVKEAGRFQNLLTCRLTSSHHITDKINSYLNG